MVEENHLSLVLHLVCLNGIALLLGQSPLMTVISDGSVTTLLHITDHNPFRNNTCKIVRELKTPPYHPSSSSLQELVKSLYPQGQREYLSFRTVKGLNG